MKILLFLLTIIPFATITGIAQTEAKNTYLQILENLAETKHLELIYSPDMVSLSDSTDFPFSANIDSCLAQLQDLSNLKIAQTDTHLIITSKVPAFIHLQGKVVDAESGELLPHANILIEQAGSGTITNLNGEFEFKIKGRFAGSEVLFSFLGYEHRKLKIPFIDSNNLVIKMVPKPYTLSDIYVLPNGNEAGDIVKRAVKNIKRNYARTTTQMEAFYRNTNYRDTVASQLIEAALLIEDKGIAKPIETTRIQIQEIRKSSNYLIPLNLRQEMFAAALSKVFGHRNIIYRSYANNLKNYIKKPGYSPLSDYKDFKYEFSGFEWLDSVKVFKIKFIYDGIMLDGIRFTKNKNAERAGFIYINSEDYAILKIDEWMRFFGEHSKRFTGKQESTIAKSETAYQKIGGKYYLKYKSGTTIPNGTFMIYENPDAPEDERIVKERQTAEYILLITKVITDKNEMDKIRFREKLARNENTYKINYPYNPEFWKNYNILKENPME
ncbi:MAG: carboxypeptidase-like regulatory domain-containing protein, partial [Prolixibacteraceae bacterium]|nr:carboxypeptidase-like regulatory domain-containing protein [Prolixibacteraceae bacterium]